MSPTDDLGWLTLCVFFEARGESDDGKAAVARVVLNRTHRKPPYRSDGTVKGTVLSPSQFSWVNFDFVAGRYRRVARTPDEVAARVAKLYAQALAGAVHWKACESVARAVLTGTYVGGEGFQKLTPEALMYVNLAVSSPPWAEPEKHIARVDSQDFYEA